MSTGEFAFTRPLTQTEWNVLQGYTRRIRFIRDFRWGIDQKSLGIISDPPITEPLFPNLRYLHCRYRTKSMHLLHLPFPSLISLDVDLQDPHWFQDSLESFAALSPNMNKLSVCVGRSDIAFNNFFSNCICRWKNLQTVICPEITLNMDALVYLSRACALTQLDFALSTTSPSSDSPLIFSNLHDVTLRSEFLDTTSWFLSQMRQPAGVNFNAIIDECPSRRELLFFWDNIQSSGANHTLTGFLLDQSSPLPSKAIRSETLLLGMEDLQPCTAFRHLRYLRFNIERTVSLTDGELLALASAWPHLEHLLINPDSGWHTQAGITPNGVLQLLQRCRSLSWIALALDTRGYTELPASGLLECLGFASPTLWFNVVDSIIRTESVPAVAAFFAPTSCSSVTIHGWLGGMVKPPGWEIYLARWDDVRSRANDGVGDDDDD